MNNLLWTQGLKEKTLKNKLEQTTFIKGFIFDVF